MNIVQKALEISGRKWSVKAIDVQIFTANSIKNQSSGKLCSVDR